MYGPLESNVCQPTGHVPMYRRVCRKTAEASSVPSRSIWPRWKYEFVHHLQSRSKWQNETRNVQLGDIVVLKEQNVPRNMWKLDKVVSANVGAD